jgi:hypothetical protein
MGILNIKYFLVERLHNLTDHQRSMHSALWQIWRTMFLNLGTRMINVEIMGETLKSYINIDREEEIEGDTVTDYIVCKKLVQLKQSTTSRNIEFDLSFRTVKRLLLLFKGSVFTQEL